MRIAWLFASCLLAAAPPPADPLTELNAAFRSAYAAVRAEALARQGPVLVVAGDDLLLLRDQQTLARAEIRPAAFHRLKAMAHVPLAIRLLVQSCLDRPLPPEALQALAQARRQVAAARAGLDQAFPDPAERGRQELILAASQAFLDAALARGQAASGDLERFCAAMGGPALANAGAAAALELEALDRVAAAWRRERPQEAWDDLRVVVIGSHMARDGEVAWQYFSRLLGEPAEGGRIVYAEGLWETRDALTLLAGHRVDAGLGRALFGDPARMHRDLLADGAAKWLDRRFPPPPTRLP